MLIAGVAQRLVRLGNSQSFCGRANTQLARELTIALPEEQKNGPGRRTFRSSRWCANLSATNDKLTSKGMVADWVYHDASLAAEVGLSPSACLRRIKLMEQAGVIRGYTALVDTSNVEATIAVIINITLDRQTEDYLDRFELEAALILPRHPMSLCPQSPLWTQTPSLPRL